MSRERQGALLCLASAAGFGAMAIFAKLAYDAGAGVVGLLAIRFAIAAALFWALALAARQAIPRGRDARRGVLLGLFYTAQAGVFFAALERIDASLAALLLYCYPAIVTASALVLGREAVSGRRLAALLVASAGVVLVLAGGGTGELDALGVALALGAALAYATYILVSQTLVESATPFGLSAVICTAAGAAFLLAGLVSGSLDLGALEAAGWGWAVAIAIVSTVLPVATFLAGLERVGPSTASILSTVEPPITVVLAFLVFEERLSGVQLAGGALVLGAVVVLSARRAAISSRGSAALAWARRAAS